MAGKRIEVQLGINADVSAAKKSINDLQNALNNLHKIQSQRGFQDFGINKAVESAHALEVSLNRALNVQTGKLDLSKFSSSLKEAGTSLHELNTSLLSAGSAGQQVFLSLASSISQAEVPLKRTSRLVQEFSRTLKNTISYQLSASMFNAVTGALSDAVSYTKNLNSSLNDIRIVTGQSAEQMAKFAASANASAQKLSTTTNSYAKASLIFYQQGLSDAEVKKRTDAVIKMANVTKENMEDVSSYMTAVWNNFDDGASSLEHYADVMTALGAATASSTKEIAAGLEKFASIGKTIGLSYEYATSAVATIVDKTRQSADTVGTGLRTIFSRLQGLSLGETLEDGVDLNKYSAALKTVGVNILDASGNMKDMDAILDSLAGKWQNLSNAQKTALAQTVGGVRQYTTLISLMDNWDSMEQNLNIANASEGSLQKQQDIYAESWEAASERSKAALEALYQTLLNDKGFISIINGLTGVTNAVTYLVDALGGLPGVLGMVGMIGTKVFSKQMTAGIEASLNKLMIWNSQFKKQDGALNALKKIGTGNTKSAAQLQAMKAAEQAMNEYKTQATTLQNANKQDSSAYYATQAAQELLTAKTDLLRVENELTETQKRNAQSQIDLMSKQQQALLELKQEKEQMAKDDKIQANKEVREVLNSMSYQQPDGYYRSDSEQEQEILGGNGKINNLMELREKAAAAQYKSEMAAFFTENATDDADLDSLRSGINDIFGAGTVADTAGLNDIRTTLEAISTEAANAEKEVTDVIKAAKGGDGTQQALRNLQTSGQNAGSSRSSIEIERLERERGLKNTQNKFNENITPGQDDPEGKAKKIAKAMQTTAQTIATVTAGISQAKSAMETFGDAGASVGDQISAGLSLASGAVTAFLTGGPWAAVAYAVSVIGTIAIDAIIKKINEAELAAQKAEEVSQSLTSAAEEAANHLNAIKSAVDGYNNAIDVLNGCTKGTEEWNTALKNVHSEISSLLNDFPELLNKNNLFNPDGTLNQTVLEQAVTEAEMSAVAANAAKMQGQVAAREARLKANKVSENRAYTAYYSTYDQYGNETYKAYNTGYKTFNDTATLNGDLEKVLNSFSSFGSESLELKDVYDALGSEMGENATITDQYAESLFNLANQSIAATTMIDNAAKSVISDWSERTGTELVIGQSDLMSAAYNDAVSIYSKALQTASDQNNKAHNVDHSKLGAEFNDTSFAGMSITEAFNAARGTNYQLASNGVQGVDSNRTYVYLENGEEKIYKFEELQATIAAAAALEKMGETAAAAKEKLASMSERLGDEKAATGIQNYIASKNLESMTQTDFESMSAAVDAEGGASAYLQKALDMTEAEIKSTLGETFIKDFENAINRTSVAWADAWGDNKNIAQAALGDIVDSMSLSDTATLSNYIESLSLGPAGEKAGSQFVEGLNKMIADIEPEKQQEAFSKLLTSVDWSSYDAFDQAQAILKDYGITISETDAYWMQFIKDMQIASGAFPDFSKIKANLNSVAGILKNLEFGDIISPEDYKVLIDYNNEWERFFLLQADGTRKFIGDSADLNKALQEATIAHRQEIELRKEVSELEGINEVDWAAGGDEAQTALQEYLKNDSFKALMEEMGYTINEIDRMTSEQKAEMYTRIGEAVNANQIELDDSEFEQMIASMATSFKDLQSLLDDGIIGTDAYSRALQAMAGEYEYCSTALKTYQDALASGNPELIKAAEEGLAAAVKAEETAEKLEDAYSHALSGKSSVTAEDLNTLKEANVDLYDSFLTMSDDEWYEAAYQAYSDFLAQRMEGHAQDSAEYKALLIEKQNLDEEYYNHLKDKDREAYEAIQEQREAQISAANDVISSIQSNLTSSKPMTFVEIEELIQGLEAAGVEGERVRQIVDSIGAEEDGSAEQIKAKMIAATEAALMAFGAQEAQKEEIEGVVTAHLANREELVNEVNEALLSADGKEVKLYYQDASGNLSTIVGQVTSINNIPGSKQVTITYIDQNGNLKSIAADTSTIIASPDGKTVTVTYTDGNNNIATLTANIEKIAASPDGKFVTITYEDGNGNIGQLSADIASIKTDANNKTVTISYTDANGNVGILAGQITKISANANSKAVTITYTDGSGNIGVLAAEVTAIDTVADGKTVTLTYTDAGGNIGTLAAEITAINIAADEKTVTLTYTDAGGNIVEMSGAVTSIDKAADGKTVTVTYIDQNNNLQTIKTNVDAINRDDLTGSYTLSVLKDEVGDTISKYQDADIEVNLKIGKDSAINGMFDARLSALGAKFTNDIEAMQKAMTMAAKGYNRENNADFYAGNDSGKAWGYTQKYAAVSLSQDLVNASNDQIMELYNSGDLGNFVKSLMDVAFSNADEDTKEYAKMILLGLGAGLQDTDLDWGQFINTLGADIDAAFRAELLIFSPSRLTKKLGPYLLEGLSVGISEGAAGWQCPSLSGIGNKVFETFKAELDPKRLAEYAQDAVDVTIDGVTVTMSGQDLMMEDFDNTLKSFLLDQQYLTSELVTPIERIFLASAEEAVLKTKGWTRDQVKSNADLWSEYGELVQAEVNKQYQEYVNDSNKLWATIKDLWTSGIESILQTEANAAAETVELWEKAFKAIANARKGLAEGKSIMESMFDDPTSVAALMQSWMNDGMTYADAMAKLTNPNTTVDYKPWDAETYRQSGDQRYLNYDATTKQYKATSRTEMEANVTKEVTDRFQEYSAEGLSKIFSADYLKMLSTSTDTSQQALAQSLVDSKILLRDKDNNLTLNLDQSTWGSDYKTVLTDVIGAVVASIMSPYKTDSDVYGLLATASVEQTRKGYQTADYVRQEGEQYINAQQESLDLVAKAREALLNGEDLKYALNAEEQSELLALTKKTDLASVSLGSLDTATTTLASTMVTCAQQIAIAMGMIQRGEASGISFDPTTGQVTVTGKTQAAIEADIDTALQGTDIMRQGDKYYDAKGRDVTNSSEVQAIIATAKTSVSGAPAANPGDTITTGSHADTTESQKTRLQYAQAAGFEGLEEQDAFIRDAENRTIVGVNGEQKNLMATQTEIQNSMIEGRLSDQNIAGWQNLDESWQSLVSSSLGEGKSSDQIEAILKATEGYDKLSDAQKEALKTASKLNLSDEERAAMLKEAEKIQQKYANQLKKMEKAYDRLAKEGKDLLKTANDEEASMSDRAKAVSGLREIYTDILGPMDKVGDAFVKNADNMKLAEEAAAGNEESLNKLQVAYLEALAGVDFTGPLQELAAEVAAWDPGDLEVGATIDDTDFLAKCAELVNKAGLTAEEASDALSAMGVDAEIEEHEVPIGEDGTTTIQAQGTIYVPKVDENGNVSYEAVDASGGYTIEGESGQTVKYYTIKGAKYNGKGVTGGGGGGTGGGGGGGRGGGGGGGGRRAERRRANHVKKDDHVERYHEIDNVIDDLSDAYERLNDQQDRAWGKNRIDAMKAQTDIIKEQVAATEEKIRQAEEYLRLDRQEAEAMGWIFDENGNVMNYDELMGSKVDEYNAAIDAYNDMSGEAQEELDNKYKEMKNEDGEYYSGYEDYLQQTLLDGPKEALEQYEETMELLEDLDMDYNDLLNAWHDNIIGQIQTKLDTTLEVTEAQLGYLEHKLSRIEDDAYSAAEAIGLMGQQMDIAQTQFNAHKSALDDLLKAYSPEGTVWSAEELMNGNISSEDLVNAGMQSGDIELIQTIMEGMMDASEQMSEQMVNSIEHMANAFEEFNADMDRYISTVEHAQAITSTYRNIIDLTGRTMSGFNSTMLKSINDAIAAQSVAKLEANKTKYETVKTEYDEAKAAYEAAQASYAAGGIDAAALKAAKDTYQAAQDNMNEAQEAFLSSWEEALQAAADAFQSNMEAAVRDIGDMMSGGLAGGLSELEDAFAKMNERDQNYVDDYEKIYQLTKMTRDLTDKIDSTSNVRAQKELLKYQKELNGLLESDQEMSAYDLDYLQKKLDLKMAEIAMDEAQNAKSQVTMRRDSEGNYNYVYTADEGAVEKAESEYADKLYEMQKANDEYITGLSENMANLSSQMLSEIAAIDTTIYDTEEKYQAEVQRITEHYTAQMEYYNSEMNKVLGNNKTLYEQDWTNFSKYTGYKLSAEENYVTKWSQTVLSQVTGFETQEEFYQNFNEAVFGGDPAHPSGESLIGRLVTAYKTMREQIAAANAAAGVETEDLATALLGNIEAATQEAEAAADGITEAATEIVSQITSIGDAVTNMVNNYSEAMATMEAETDAMLGVLLDFLTAYGEIGDLDIDPGVLAEIEARRQARQENPEGYDTGGYTGAWGTEGRLAYLHQKELVLNADDTANMLASVGILRQIASVIDLNALASAGGFISLMSAGVAGNQGTLQQEVHIEANFPGVTDKNQIEEAFSDLVNLAAQYANRQ